MVIVKLQRNTNNGQHFINIPSVIVDLKKWEKGQDFEILELNGDIVIRKSGERFEKSQ